MSVEILFPHTMAERYMGKSNAKAYGRRNSSDGEVLVRITPNKIIGEKNIAEWEIGSTNSEPYLKEDNMNANTWQARKEKNEVIEELEEKGELPKDVLKGGERYEDEEPRQGL